jgi:CRISPR/Cas system endoribonuclease Cas6 (RAMP superfamily)
MEVIKKTVKPFSAKVTLGLELGYTGELIEKTEIIQHIQKIQNNLIKNKDIFLSVSISESNIVMSGQIEPHVTLSFIN